MSGEKDVSGLYRIMCCGLKSAEKLLEDFGMPVPATSQIVAHEPVLMPGCCDTLWVCPGPSRRISSAKDGCVPRRTISMDVCLFRCVHVENPLQQGTCFDTGDCAEVIPCPGDEIDPRPGNVCERGAPDKATETLWLMEERWLLETHLASTWSTCLCEGWCDQKCGETLGCRDIEWVSSKRYDSGGCGGTIATFEINYP